MKAVFRLDSSQLIGTGHLMRCLALAEGLRKKKFEIYFVCRDLSGHVAERISLMSFHLLLLPRNVEFERTAMDQPEYQQWLGTSQEEEYAQMLSVLKMLLDVTVVVVDHYALDISWERVVKPHTKLLMVIDDLANRPHDCDILLDQNYYKRSASRYQEWVSPSCQMLLGPAFALLRSTMVLHREEPFIKKDPVIQSILIFMGGADRIGINLKIIKAIDQFYIEKFQGIKFCILIGNCSDLNAIEKIVKKKANFQLLTFTDPIEKLIKEHQLVIGGSGVSLLERCCLGVPSMVISIAENQVLIARDGHGKFLHYFGDQSEFNDGFFIEELCRLISNQGYLHSLALAGWQLVDGLGVSRVVNRIMSYI